MNALKKLQIEYDGIYGTIDEYTSDPNVMNYLIKLQEGIRENDYETVCYSLDKIIDWYNQNIKKISSNPYVGNLDSHKNNIALLKEIKEELNIDDFVSIASVGPSSVKKDKVIFLSHSSSDKKYADALRNLIIGLGVKDNQLIYTSHPLHKIPLDKNIYDYLRNNINSEIFMIILWSNDYLASPACLNEMGAAWVTQSDYTNIYVPDFSFGNPKYHECAVDTQKMGAVLNGDAHCKASIIEFKDKLERIFCLDNGERKITYLVDKFMEEIDKE